MSSKWVEISVLSELPLSKCQRLLMLSVQNSLPEVRDDKDSTANNTSKPKKGRRKTAAVENIPNKRHADTQQREAQRSHGVYRGFAPAGTLLNVTLLHLDRQAHRQHLSRTREGLPAKLASFRSNDGDAQRYSRRRSAS